MTPGSAVPDLGRVYSIVGKRIRALREARELTAEELGRRAGISRTSIAQAEAGHQRLPLETLYQLAFALDVTVPDILPSLGELLVEPGEILSRVAADDALAPSERDALIEFFSHHLNRER